MDIQVIDVKEQINTYFKKYALYVIQARGIPNFYDGLTPVQRLILLNAPDKNEGTIGLVGSVMKTGLYHHGDQSLIGAINKMARTFGCSEPMLVGDGFFGTPVNPKAASARYTKVKISTFAKNTFKTNEALNVKNSEGGYDWLHVTVPMGLVTHVVGIAVGYSSNILPRKIGDVQEYLDGKNKQLKPYFAGFGGTIKKHNGLDKSWLIEGVLEIDEKTMTLKIGDIPPLMRYDSFIRKVFAKVEELGDNCKVENNSSEHIDITMKWRDPATWTQFRDAISKLTKMIAVEGLVFVKDGAVVEYEDITHYLDEFRIHQQRVIYKKMVYDLAVSNDELEYLRAKVLFMKFMMERKRKREEVKNWMSNYKPKIRMRLDNIKLTMLTTEHLKETEDQIKEMIQKIKGQEVECAKQLAKCKSLEKGFKGKGKVSMESTVSILDEIGIPQLLDGIEVYNAELDSEFETIDGDVDNNIEVPEVD
jgi:DNA gyrase/topoisomerase IV subunit A